MRFNVSSELLASEPQLGNIHLNEEKLHACIGMSCRELQDILSNPHSKKRDALFGKVLRRTTKFGPHALTMFALDINNLSSITGDDAPSHDSKYFMFLAGSDNCTVRYAQPVLGKLNTASAYLTQARAITQFVMRHVPIRSPQDQANATPVIILRHLLSDPKDLAQLAQSYDLVLDISGDAGEAQRLLTAAIDGLMAQLGANFPHDFNFEAQPFLVHKLDYQLQLPNTKQPKLLQFYAITNPEEIATEIEDLEPSSDPNRALTEALISNISIVGTTLDESDAAKLPDLLITLWGIANLLKHKEEYYTDGQGYHGIRSLGVNLAIQAIATIAALTPQCDD